MMDNPDAKEMNTGSPPQGRELAHSLGPTHTL